LEIGKVVTRDVDGYPFATLPPQPKARAKNEMIMGGRYLMGSYKGEMMGMPFEGYSMTGYDNAAKKLC
jgi:hypothetical protein